MHWVGPTLGSALTDLRTSARIDGSSVIINGQKRWTSGGGHSDMVVFARFNSVPGAKVSGCRLPHQRFPGSQPSAHLPHLSSPRTPQGIGAVYVPRDARGVSFGKPEVLMGFRGVPSTDIYFDDVRVPASNILAQPPDGFRTLMSIFCVERLGASPTSGCSARGRRTNLRSPGWGVGCGCGWVGMLRERDDVVCAGAGGAGRTPFVRGWGWGRAGGGGVYTKRPNADARHDVGFGRGGCFSLRMWLCTCRSGGSLDGRSPTFRRCSSSWRK